MKNKYTNDLEFEDESANYFERGYGHREIRELPPSIFLERVISNSGLNPKGMDVLEIGCGAAPNLNWLHSSFDCRCTGVEPNKAVVEKLRRNYPGMRFEQAEAKALPFEDAAFDLVLIRSVLHWIRRDTVLHAIGEAVRCSRAYLIISDFFPSSAFKTPYRDRVDFFTFHIDYGPVILGLGIFDLMYEETGIAYLENGIPVFEPIADDVHRTGRHDWDCVKTSIYRRDDERIATKSQSSFEGF